MKLRFCILQFSTYFTLVRPSINDIFVEANHSNIPNLTHGGVLTAEEFTSIILTCSASGVPLPVMTWLRNGVLLTNTSLRTIDSTVGNNTGGAEIISTTTLRINELQLTDAAMYTCRAVSGNVSPIPGVTSWTININVTCKYIMLWMTMYCDV